MRDDDGTFVFESREDVLRELTDGRHAFDYLGWECPECGRILVRVFTHKLTPLSSLEYMRLPPDVELDIELLWREFDGRDRPAPQCPKDGNAMRPIESAHHWR